MPLIVFVAACAAAVVFYLWVARHWWFVADDWDFLAHRSATSLHDLFRPHNEHWSTLPILQFRALFAIFGVRSYVPYLVPLLLAHVLLAFLARVVMVRAGVNEWVATAAGCLLLFYGCGSDDILSVFQIGFTGALGFGYAQLLFTDHPGPINRRDVLGLLAGLGGLLSSGVGVTMVVVVGLAVLVRRGWRPAALQTIPLGLAYVVWYLVIGHEGYRAAGSVGQAPGFVYDQFRGTFRTLGQIPGMGVVLVVVLVVGLVQAWRALGPEDRRERLTSPLALLVGSAVFALVAASGRAVSQQTLFHAALEPSRYLYVLAALVLPALAVAVDTVCGLLPRYGVAAAAVVFLVGIPGNIRVVVRDADQVAGGMQTARSTVVAIAGLPITRQLPRSLEPISPFASTASVGWLLQAAALGRLPHMAPIAPAEAATLTQSLALADVSPPRRLDGCELVHAPVTGELSKGQLIVVDRGSSTTVGYLPSGAPDPSPLALGSPAARTARRLLAAGYRFRIAPAEGATVWLCG